MATQAAQAGPSQRARTSSGDSGRSTALHTKSAAAALHEDPSDYEEGGSEYESEEEVAYATVKGKGVAAPPLPRAQIHSTRSASYERERSSTSWADLDLSIIVACVSPVGNWLTGGDHIKNLFLIILLVFYLHQLIEVPWKLYQASRPRKSAGARSGEPDRVTKLAATELRRQELLLLVVTAISPLIGATFLKHVLSALGERESLSWFSTTLFVLATGIRPWTHLISRIQGRTESLHDAIHYPPEKVGAEDLAVNAVLLKRLDLLEREFHELQARTTLAGRLQEVCDDLSEAVGELERGGKRSERKAEIARLALAARLAALEKGLLQVEQNRRMDVDALRRGYVAPFYERGYRRAWGYIRPLVRGVLRFPKTIWALGAPDATSEKWMAGGSPSPLPSPSPPVSRSSNGTVHHRLSSNGAPDPRLTTILESPQSDGEGEPGGEDEADSDGTYVTENEKDHAATANGTTNGHHKTRRARNKSGSRSRSRSHSGGSSTRKHAAQATPLSFHQWVFECVQTIVLWPYRASVRILLAMVPPLRKFA
ncbi:hypothetical protein EVJ58_g5665 [Rhodofomes roseus]|uniref:Uncharacterized protein n=1 Tax=Rhodofomes roseus TaxID=34475 RepID=A0A4Y9YDK1_9APHY|nr:hypothetical protein EVJ58_g5665 [Rhodofomes roseus]